SSGGDGDVSFNWTLVSGNAAFVGPTNIPGPQLKLNGVGDVTVKLAVSDGICDDPASATMTFNVFCEEEAEVAAILVPPGPHDVGSTVVIDSAGSSAGSRTWSLVSGPGEIVGGV